MYIFTHIQIFRKVFNTNYRDKNSNGTVKNCIVSKKVSMHASANNKDIQEYDNSINTYFVYFLFTIRIYKCRIKQRL